MGKVIQLRPPRDLGALTLMRCSLCGQGIRVSDLTRGYKKGLRLDGATRLTVNEFLCPDCFITLPPNEREQWLNLGQLVDGDSLR